MEESAEDKARLILFKPLLGKVGLFGFAGFLVFFLNLVWFFVCFGFWFDFFFFLHL